MWCKENADVLRIVNEKADISYEDRLALANKSKNDLLTAILFTSTAEKIRLALNSGVIHSNPMTDQKYDNIRGVLMKNLWSVDSELYKSTRSELNEIGLED